MRSFDYTITYEELLTPDIVALLATIHEYKGEQNPFLRAKEDTLTHLLEMAKIQSTAASNRIEGIYTSDERLKKIVLDKTMPRSRDEEEIAGYRDVLDTIHENYEYIPIKAPMLLQLHRDLYRYSGKSIGGNYKNVDNVIAEEDETGNRRIRFQPVPAWETPEAVGDLCAALDNAQNREDRDALLLLPMFILDFLCIHPFNDGNGRMSRLLTLLLLYRAGYMAGKYVSIEKLIETSKETYYEALQQSSQGWHEGKNDYAPFVKYLLGVIAAAYREFFNRVQLLDSEKQSKPERIAALIRSTTGKITKSQIMARCPGVAQATVQRTLIELQKTGKIIKIGGGRYTSYTWNWENER